jgi:hypothetical protein
VPFCSDCTVTFSVEGVAWLSGVYFTFADEPTASLVPGAAAAELAGALVDDAGVDAAGAGAGPGDAAPCADDEELLLPHAARPAARPAVARTIPALLRRLYQAVSVIKAPSGFSGTSVAIGAVPDNRVTDLHFCPRHP